MFDFVDELPQIEGGSTAIYVEFSKALVENPFRWAVLPRSFDTKSQVKTAANNIGYGQYKSFPKGQFETAMRGMQVFVRYVGD